MPNTRETSADHLPWRCRELWSQFLETSSKEAVQSKMHSMCWPCPCVSCQRGWSSWVQKGFCLKFYELWLRKQHLSLSLWELMVFSDGTTLGASGSSQMPGKEKLMAHISAENYALFIGIWGPKTSRALLEHHLRIWCGLSGLIGSSRFNTSANTVMGR